MPRHSGALHLGKVCPWTESNVCESTHCSSVTPALLSRVLSSLQSDGGYYYMAVGRITKEPYQSTANTKVLHSGGHEELKQACPLYPPVLCTQLLSPMPLCPCCLVLTPSFNPFGSTRS